MRLSLIIPCYNEAENLPFLLERCVSVASQPLTEVILVDNGSTDSTQLVLSELLPKFPNFRSVRVSFNQGYGYGILSGLRVAEGDILSWTHADMQTDPADVLKGIQFFDRHGPDIFVKGKRYGRPFTDVAFTVGMSVFETILLRKRMWDINAQPTMFSKKFFESWRNPPHDFSLDLFAYHQSFEKDLPIHRFPVRFGSRLHGSSHWNIDWKSKRKFIGRTIDFSLRLRRRSDK